MRTNLLVNPSFEQNDLYTGTGGNVTKSQSSTKFFSGLYSLKMVSTTAEDRIYYTLSDGFTATVGQQYIFSAYLQGSGTIRLWVYDGSTDQYSSDITLTSEWTRYSLVFTAQATTGLYAGFRQKNTEALTCYIDACLLESGSDLNSYFDGDTDGFDWDGAAGASTSSTASTISLPTTTLRSIETRVVHIGSQSLDVHTNTQSDIDLIVNTVATKIPHLNYIAIGTYMDYPDQFEKWASAIHNVGKRMFVRSSGFSDWLGQNQVTQYTGTDFIEHCKSKYVEFINQYYSIFESGDVFECVPDEPENNTMWDIVYTSLATTEGGIAYNNFITDSISQINTALTNNGVTGVILNYVFTNPSATRDIITQDVANTLSADGTDNYPEEGLTTPQQMADAMQTLMGDWIVPSHAGVSKHITFGPDVYSQLNKLDQSTAAELELDVIRNTISNLEGITFWQLGAKDNSPRSRGFDWSGSKWDARLITQVIDNFFMRTTPTGSTLPFSKKKPKIEPREEF